MSEPSPTHDHEAAAPLLAPTADELSSTPVYPLIHSVKRDIIEHIDTPLTYDQLLAPDTTYTIVRPLVDKYVKMGNLSIIFCLLLNRVQFIRTSTSLSLAAISLSRAALCELLAIRVFRESSERTVQLSTILLTPWDVYQGASDTVHQKLIEDDEPSIEAVGNALEMAIISKSKRFIRSRSCQKVIGKVWNGDVVYQGSNGAHSIIADNYKRHPIRLHNPFTSSLLNHYRLKVPRVRAVLEYFNFLVLFVLYVLCLELSDPMHVDRTEWAFIIYAAGFSLDKLAAMQENGLLVYSSNLWNGFDLAFVCVFLTYCTCRVWGLSTLFGGQIHEDIARLGNDVLCMGVVFMVPRLAFVTLPDTLMVLALRSMIAEFVQLMVLATFCFSGFLYALYMIADKRISAPTIFWSMCDIWFGLDAQGFQTSGEYHPTFGPILFVVYACLSNTLIVAVIVSVLSRTFAEVSADATQESMFRRAVSTVEGVKSDAVFSFQPPLNIFAVIIMVPMRRVLSERHFHKLNVFLIRVCSFPILIFISLHERQVFRRSAFIEKAGDWFEDVLEMLPRGLQQMPLIEGLVGQSSEIEQVFSMEDEVGGQESGWDLDIDSEEESCTSPPPSPDESKAARVASPACGAAPQASNPSPQPRPPMPTSSPSMIIPRPRARRASMNSQTNPSPSPLAQLFVTPSFRTSHLPNATPRSHASISGIRRSASTSENLPNPPLSRLKASHHPRALSLTHAPFPSPIAEVPTTPSIHSSRDQSTSELMQREMQRSMEPEDGGRIEALEAKLTRMESMLERMEGLLLEKAASRSDSATAANELDPSWAGDEIGV